MRQKLLFVGIVLAAAAAVALGFVDLGAIGARLRGLFFRARAEAAQFSSTPGVTGDVRLAAACRANLERVSAAKRKAAQDRGQAVGAVTWEEVVRAMYPRERVTPARMQQLMPRCPAGGTYTLGTMEQLPRCSLAGSASFDTADDHVILR
jgi:hypothetical protein